MTPTPTPSSAADDIIREAMRRLDSIPLPAYVSISAFRHRSADSYTIIHNVTLGTNGNELRVSSADLLEATDRIIAMHRLREGLTTPQLQFPRLASPQASAELDDDVPF